MSPQIMARWTVLTGLLLMVLGAVDPLEGSLLIVMGHLLCFSGVRLGGRPTPRQARLMLVPPLILVLAACLAILRHGWSWIPLLLLGLVCVAALVLEWGIRRGAPAEPRCVGISAGMTVLGVAAMWILSSFGGYGQGALSWWWALLVLPYPLGWLRGLYSLGRWIGEGADSSAHAKN